MAVFSAERDWAPARADFLDAVLGQLPSVTWAAQHHVPYFYFDAFDEDWKATEHGAGTHWGLYELDGNLKAALAQWLPAEDGRAPGQRVSAGCRAGRAAGHRGARSLPGPLPAHRVLAAVQDEHGPRFGGLLKVTIRRLRT